MSTTYPLEFHRRSEQKWILRAQAWSARESTPRAATNNGDGRPSPRAQETQLNSGRVATAAGGLQGSS